MVLRRRPSFASRWFHRPVPTDSRMCGVCPSLQVSYMSRHSIGEEIGLNTRP
jgi:hypothetical protein